MNEEGLKSFVFESNRISDIDSEAADEVHLVALTKLLKVKNVFIEDIITFIHQIEPTSNLRTSENILMINGEKLIDGTLASGQLLNTLRLVRNKEIRPWTTYSEVNYYCPFTDGNSRMARALWLWQMLTQFNWDMQYPFLQMYHYQTLNKYRSMEGFKL